MKKLLFLILVLGISCSNMPNLFSHPTEEEYEYAADYKALQFDLGYTNYSGLSAALGFRYWLFSFSIGLSGFANKIPAYSMDSYSVNINPMQPLPNGYEEEKYGALLVTADLGFHYDITENIGLFASIGYYSSTDTLLAYNYSKDIRYYYKYYVSDGIAFSVGGDYFLTDQIKAGLGYHTRRGIFARISYIWF